MTTAACTSPSPVTTAATSSGTSTSTSTGARVARLARAARRRWREHRDLLAPVGPEPAGPWAGSDRPDRDRVRVLAELRAAPRG